MPAISPDLDRLLREIPKVELHVHIEGTLEPEMVFALAAKHGVTLPYANVAELRAAYSFSDLQSFLDVLYAGCNLLRDEADFYVLTTAYLRRIHADNVVHAEIFFDPQAHTGRGVPMDAIVGGIKRALDDGRTELGITSELILCFLRHLSEEDALATWDAALPFASEFAGVGLDSGERGNPPSKFERVFAAARAAGMRAVAHAGEEGPPAYITEALDLLQVVRIDHGVRCVEDDAVVERLVQQQVPLTVCPLSNVKLCVFPTMADHNLADLLQRGLRVTVNSDDPAYNGGYLLDNYRAICEALPIGPAEVLQLARNAVTSSWLPAERQTALLAQLR